MTQGSLDFSAPPSNGTATSDAAAESIATSAATLRARVLAAIQAAGSFGCTDEELQIALDMNPSTERPRRIELRDKNLVVDSGRTRRTKSGRAAVVWIASTPKP